MKQKGRKDGGPTQGDPVGRSAPAGLESEAGNEYANL
jgi:hypothetical protein